MGSKNLIGTSEAFKLAERAGLHIKKLLAAMKGWAAESKIMEVCGEKMIERDFRPGGRVCRTFGELFWNWLQHFAEEENEKVAALSEAATEFINFGIRFIDYVFLFFIG